MHNLHYWPISLSGNKIFSICCCHLLLFFLANMLLLAYSINVNPKGRSHIWKISRAYSLSSSLRKHHSAPRIWKLILILSNLRLTTQDIHYFSECLHFDTATKHILLTEVEALTRYLLTFTSTVNSDLFYIQLFALAK